MPYVDKLAKPEFENVRAALDRYYTKLMGQAIKNKDFDRVKSLMKELEVVIKKIEKHGVME
jgi:hypothetical protein